MTTLTHEQHINFFRKKQIKFTIGLLIMIALLYGASAVAKYSFSDSITTIPAAAVWMWEHLKFQQSTLEKLPKILRVLWETIILSVLATTTASVLGLLFALAGSKATQFNTFTAFIARFVASFFRNIPIVAWALVIVISFGQNAFTGYLALFFATFGFLSRAFTETIDETTSDTVEALKATGATYSQIIAKAVIPESMPQMISWILFMIETNIRSSTLIGILTGSGIGYLFDMYYKRMDYEMVALITLAIVITVLLIEIISNYIRREIL